MQPLSDIKVLDLTWHVAGPYATRLLADYGADVVKVERPGSGDPSRTYGPFRNDAPHLEKSGTFLHLNANKRSVTLNLKTEVGKQAVIEIARWADVAVENFSPGVVARLGLDYEALRRANPRLVMCSVSNFGQTGPYRDRKGTEFTIAAMAGLTLTTGALGREPLKSPDHLYEYQAGAMAAVAIMGAVRRQRHEDAGQRIDVSIHEVAATSANRRMTALTGYAYTGMVVGRESARLTALPEGVWPCKDGYVLMSVSPPARWTRFVEMVGHPELVNDKRLHTQDFWTTTEAQELVNELTYPWLAERSMQEVMAQAQAAGIAGTAFRTTLDVLDDPHLRQRGYWSEARHPVAGRFVHTGPSFRTHAGAWRLRNTAPLLGEHNDEVLGGQLGFSRAELTMLRQTGAV